MYEMFAGLNFKKNLEKSKLNVKGEQNRIKEKDVKQDSQEDLLRYMQDVHFLEL